MDFTELTKEEFQTFFDHHPLRTFLQSPKIGELREQSGWKIDYVGLKKGDEIIAATMLLSKPQFMNKLEFYAPRGFLLDYNNTEVLRKFTEEVKKFAQERQGYILRIDPYLVKQERDIHGEIVEGGKNNLSIIQELNHLGFHESKTNEQIKWMFCLDVEGKDEETLKKEMKPNTRRSIQKAEKSGVVVREFSYDELNRFKEITKNTSERIGFHDKTLKYYQNMYQILHPTGEVKYLAAELDTKTYIERVENEIEKIKAKMNTDNQSKKKSLAKDLELQENNLREMQRLQKKHGEMILLAGSMFITNCTEVIYLFSGNFDELMQYKGQYLIQWEMIKYAKEHGFHRYNFYGISGSFDKKNSEYGVYEFKKGFNGYVEELIGEFEMPLNHYYTLYKNNLAIRKMIKKIIKK